MEVLKRCVRKLTYYKNRTALMVLFYTAVFVVFFVVATAYGAVRHEIQQAESTVGCSLYIRKTQKSIYWSDSAQRANLENPEIETFTSQELVKDYNPVAYSTIAYDLEKNSDRADYEYPTVICRDSSMLPHFTSMGYRLLEGEGISERNEDQDVIVISERMAKEENIQLGDKMKLEGTAYTTGYATAGKQLEMKVVGIYSVDRDPVSDAGAIKAVNPEYILFLPMQAVVNASFLQGGINTLWLSFDSMENVAAYVEWFEENYGEPVFHDIPDKESATGDYFDYYMYQWNEDGYQKIVRPLLELKRLCEVLLLVVGITAALIIWNVGAMALRAARREFAILQSCGEGSGKVLWQNLLEQVVPIACAAILAALVASAASGQISQFLTREYMGSQGQITEISNQKYDMQVIFKTDPVSRAITYVGPTDTRLPEIERPDVSAGRWAGALLAGLGAILAALYLQGLWYFRKKKIHEMMQEE